MKGILCIMVVASAVSIIFGNPRNHQKRNTPQEMSNGNNNENGFPMGAQVLVKFPTEEQQRPKRASPPNDRTRPSSTVVAEPRGGNLFNLSSYLNSANRPTTGAGLTFVPLITLFSGLFQG